MKKLVFTLCASLALTGMFTSGAMAFSNAQYQPKNISDQLYIQASAGCVVNWVNGSCASSDFVRSNNGGHTTNVPPPPPVIVPPPPPPPPPDEGGCMRLTVSIACDW